MAIKFLKKFLKTVFVFSIIFSWIFSGWPRIWNNPPFPPKIQQAEAAVVTNGATANEAVTTGWTNAANAHGTTNDDVYATAAPAKNAIIDSRYFTYGFDGVLPSDAVITAVKAIPQWKASACPGAFITLEIEAVIGGVVQGVHSISCQLTEADSTVDLTADRSWTRSDLLNANFKIRVGFRRGNTNTASTGSLDMIPVEVTYTQPITFLGNDTDPGVNPTIAPGAATTTVGTFNLKTSSGSDTVTNATTTLSAGSFTGLFGVEITNSANTTIYCSSYNPTGVVVGLVGCNLPVTSASTTFNIRIKPKSHAAMDAPPGATYTVTATTTAITATNTTSGSDTTSDTVTIDNASPNGATATSGTAGDANVTLNWTTSNSSDFDTTNGSVILRWAAASAGSEVPAEGNSSYSAGNTIGAATVACVISSAASASLSKIDGSGGSAGCTTSALTNGQAYTYVAFQRDINGNYDAGASIGTFTPQAVSLTFTIDTSSVSFVSTLTPGTPVSTSSVLTVNTNSSSGYNITLARASTTPTLFLSTDTSTTISDNPNGNNWTAPATSSAAGPSAVWTSGTTKSLGFRLKQTGTVVNTYSTAWWGTSDADANAKYSGISTSTAAQIITKSVWVGSATNENTVMEYKIDVNANQKSGNYTSSPITFTALPN